MSILESLDGTTEIHLALSMPCQQGPVPVMDLMDLTDIEGLVLFGLFIISSLYLYIYIFIYYLYLITFIYFITFDLFTLIYSSVVFL